MTAFTATIEQFGAMGEKTGWTYIKVPAAIALELMPGNKKSFRVKGKLDQWNFEQLALIPFGGGDFILALNATIRKEIKKGKGAKLKVLLALDKKLLAVSADFLACLQDEPRALTYFNRLPPSHQHYYSKWIESAKTNETKSKRIASALKALSKEMGYGEMLRLQQQDRKDME